MARQIFIEESLNEDFHSQVLKNKKEPLDIFWEKTFCPLKALVLEQIEECLPDPSVGSKLYFLGSFSRGMAGSGSDLDLLLLSDDEKEAFRFNENLRTVFSSYSLKRLSSIEELGEKSDEKGLLSAWFLEPAFDGKDVKEEVRAWIKKNRKDEIENFFKKENSSRYKRYGGRPGRLNFHIKNSPGGLLDLTQLQWRESFLENDLGLEKAEKFLYKTRCLFNLYSGADTLNFSDVPQISKDFSYLDEQIFFKELFSSLIYISTLLNTYRGHEDRFNLKKLLGGVASLEEMSNAEALLYVVKGLVLSPSYHVWTVDQHILTAIDEVTDFSQKFKEAYQITQSEIEILKWAAFFHDISKGQEGAHSILGAAEAQEFGKKHGWSSEKTETVSWLVREHLTLVKNAFKMDIYHKDFVRKLALRGCEGRKAVLLFVLSCADIKATNPSSWSEWKEGALKEALNQILGVKNNLKEKILKEVTLNSIASEVLEELSLKEICMVPFDLLVKDLKAVKSEGVVFYEHENRTWVRVYSEKDEFGLAEKFIEALFMAGAYIHHASFKTLRSSSAVYNWVCVETGVSPKAFKNRFKLIFEKVPKIEESREAVEGVKFRRVRRTFLKNNYAVVSFKGEDKAGALISAVRTLKESGLNIQWGHAVTWGAEIEDVFGVSFKEEPDWSFLTET